MTSAAAPGQQVWGKGGVVHLLYHPARNAQPVLHSDFALLGGWAVDDQLFPCFLGFCVGSAVGPAADQGSQLPCFLGWRAPVREASGPVCSLEGGGTSSLWGGRGGLLL